ncbi:interleukin-1 beta-like isoform X2 [Denticeps clupeoides]|uniref:interleukin-1 beta-like isoform X2 n=1 Tax=Denticeps clupeoides TaxID=299321 RepID=UPI0010A52CB7|nr:interleukin-1 beta-like isoform X2 [Denticeps clupeoides]
MSSTLLDVSPSSDSAAAVEFDECAERHHVKESGAADEDVHCSLHSGLRIEMCQHPHTMHQVVKLIVYLKRMRKSQKLISTEFSDHELCDMFMGAVMEECAVMEVQEPTHAAAQNFSKTGKVTQCKICDEYNKSLVLNKSVPELQAIVLPGGNESKSVKLNLSTYVTPTATRPQAQPIALGIVDSNFYLACKATSDKTPVLTVEVISDQQQLETINAEGDMARFLFFKSVNGQSMNTFESAKFPGYFISTSFKDQKPVEVCKQQVTERINTFRVNKV